MRARDIMTPNPSVAVPDDSIARAATVMRDRHVEMLPVIDNLRTRHLVGVVTDHDIVVRCVARGYEVERPVGELMTTASLAAVDIEATPEEVVALMNRRGLRRIPVVDDRARVVGVITLADVAKRTRSSNALGLGWARAPVADRGKTKAG